MIPERQQIAWGVAAVVLVLWLGVAGTGCHLVQGAADLPGDAVRVVTPGRPRGKAVDLAELQEQLFRFADQYLARVLGAVDELEATSPEMTRELVQRIRLGYANDVLMAAAGPNTYADLLDLVTITTLSRTVIEEHWIPEVFGESAKPLLEVVQTAEQDIWAIADRVLTTDEQHELKEAIRVWREENPYSTHAMYVRAVGLSGRLADSSPRDHNRPGSVFSLLMIDPLSGLDPATRELAQARLSAERAIYVAQRMPYMLRWQAEMFSARVAGMPEARQLLTNSTQLAEAATRLSHAAEQLPDRFSQERKELVQVLQSEQQNLRELSTEVRDTLQAGSQMASNAHRALESFDAVVQRLESSGDESDSEPFRIRDYTEAAEQLDETTLHLAALLQELDAALASTNMHGLVDEVAPVVEDVEASGRDLVDHVFQRAILLLLIACGLFLVTALIYRRFAANAGAGTRT